MLLPFRLKGRYAELHVPENDIPKFIEIRKERKVPKYIKLNERIHHYKGELQRWLQENVNRKDVSSQQIDNKLLEYMDKMQFLLAGQDPDSWKML